MTQEELNEYNRLTPQQKQFYNMGMEAYPGWSHAQAFSYAIICDPTNYDDITIINQNDGNGSDKNKILKAVISKVNNIIEKDFPRIYKQVKEKFSQILCWLDNAVSATWNSILNWFRTL